jgi:hypothetical protein
MKICIPSTSIEAKHALEACKTAIAKGEQEEARTWLAVWKERKNGTPCLLLTQTILMAMETNCHSIVAKFATVVPAKEMPWEGLVQYAINKCHSVPAFKWLQALHALRCTAETGASRYVERDWECITRKVSGISLTAAIVVNDALAARIHYRVFTPQDHSVTCFAIDAPADLLWTVITKQFPVEKIGGCDNAVDICRLNRTVCQNLLKKPLANQPNTIAGAMALLLLVERSPRL